MTDLARAGHQLQPGDRSPWTTFMVERALAERPAKMSAERTLQFMEELALKLGALSEWDRYSPPHHHPVTFKRGYREVARLDGHSRLVSSVNALRDGRIVSGSYDHSLKIWTQVHGGEWISEPLGRHCGEVECVGSLPDGRVVSSAQYDTVLVWAPKASGGWRESSEIKCPKDVHRLQGLPDGRVVLGQFDGRIFLSHPTEDRHYCRVEHIGTAESLIRSLKVLPGNKIVTAHEDGSLKMWSRGASQAWRVNDIKVVDGALHALTVLPDGRIVLAVDDGFVQELVPKSDGSYEASRIGKHDGWVRALGTFADGRIISGGVDDTIRIWERLSSGVWRQEILKACQDGVITLTMFSDGRIVSGGRDGTIRIWDGSPVCDGGAL